MGQRSKIHVHVPLCENKVNGKLWALACGVVVKMKIETENVERNQTAPVKYNGMTKGTEPSRTIRCETKANANANKETKRKAKQRRRRRRREKKRLLTMTNVFN